MTELVEMTVDDGLCTLTLNRRRLFDQFFQELVLTLLGHDQLV